MAENWTYSLFFLMAELWGAVVISVLFWTLANEVCTVKEAKTIYPLMGIAANVALVAAGNFMKLVSRSLAVRGRLLWRLCASKCPPCSSHATAEPCMKAQTICMGLGMLPRLALPVSVSGICSERRKSGLAVSALSLALALS